MHLLLYFPVTTIAQIWNEYREASLCIITESRTASLEQHTPSITVLLKLSAIVLSTSADSSYWTDHIPCEVSLKAPINFNEKIEILKYQLFSSVSLFSCHCTFIKLIYFSVLETCHLILMNNHYDYYTSGFLRCILKRKLDGSMLFWHLKTKIVFTTRSGFK